MSRTRSNCTTPGALTPSSERDWNRSCKSAEFEDVKMSDAFESRLASKIASKIASRISTPNKSGARTPKTPRSRGSDSRTPRSDSRTPRSQGSDSRTPNGMRSHNPLRNELAIIPERDESPPRGGYLPGYVPIRSRKSSPPPSPPRGGYLPGYVPKSNEVSTHNSSSNHFTVPYHVQQTPVIRVALTDGNQGAYVEAPVKNGTSFNFGSSTAKIHFKY